MGHVFVVETGGMPTLKETGNEGPVTVQVRGACDKRIVHVLLL
jgi:hypothetical protein